MLSCRRERNGFEVLPARDGQAGPCAGNQARCPDSILTDMCMPMLDAFACSDDPAITSPFADYPQRQWRASYACP